MKTRYLLSLVALSVASACQAASYPAPLGPSQTDFGGAGLLQTPTARMAKEGEFSFNYRDNDQYRFYSVSVQPMPWLETTIRYTDVRTRKYSSDPSFSGSQTYKDKSFDVKLRLWQEGYWLPEVSAGVRDIGGTGLFDGEYLVASKAWGPLDFTLGMGWGYLGNRGDIRNPFCDVSDRFCERKSVHTSTGGTVDLNEAFRGPAAIFGGVEYQTPWQPLRLKLEYEGNDYQDDFAGRLKQDSKFNFGAVYRVTDWADINMSYQRGNTFMAGFTLRTNFNELTPAHIDQPKPDYQPEPQGKQLQQDVVANQLSALEENAGFSAPKIQVKDNTLYMTGTQSKYRYSEDGIERANIILMNHLPEGIDTLDVTETRYGLPQVTTRTDVSSLRSQLEGYPLGYEQVLQQKRLDPQLPENTDQGYYIDDDRLSFTLSPTLTQSVGGAETFYMYQIGLLGSVNWWVTDHLLTSGSVFVNLTNNYDRFNYTEPPPDSRLPRVRTHIREYVENDVYINDLQANYFQSFGHGLYGQVYGGYLESMFGGVGAEMLYRPLDSDWAVGVNANWVKQRDWDDMMRFTDYDTVTGHVTGYWKLPFADDVLAALSVGEYLAKDKGATIDLSKRFDSGVVAGVYASFTDASREEYGEGSFTKGFYISIPLELMTNSPSRSRTQIGWTPLTRDGGQMLGRKYQLYGMTSDRDVRFR
ncbi:membrane protein [Chania multitudinisentens RB-25]|uniref:Membrane protein n=1 Tax=Chania multitudinisentens RB-25 TaxID=1441930 RepID=W0LD29_9GAMM|nr:YjbH domain-containing protein [Chania multitudinisentens]AHG19860.1 membrane protein [Chania multitudinisentens RB-25]